MNNILRLEIEGYDPFSATNPSSVIERLSHHWETNPQTKFVVTKLPKRDDPQSIELEARAMFVTLCLATNSAIDVSEYVDYIPLEVVQRVKTMLNGSS